ncbi:MAG: glycine/sarcosine/betaine reductase component B subunit, partial [Acidimicrobiales bacterium]
MTQEPGDDLTRLVHRVTEVDLGPETTFDGGRLTVSTESARACLADAALGDVRISWVSPGESARIVKILDAVEPRTKGPGGGGVFAGFVGPERLGGRGVTHVMRGAAVVAAGYLPRAQEAVVEMSGPAAALSPLGATHNLVVEFTPADGAAWEDVDVALRKGMLALAVHVADAALEAPPYAEEHFPAPTAPMAGRDRPRVGAVTNLQTQGTFKDTFVYGRSFSGGLPTLLDPGEIDDGAV